MKTLNIHIMLAVGILISCSNDEKIVDQVFDTTISGAILRTKEIKNNLVYNAAMLEFEEGSRYSITIEEQDDQNGALLSSVICYAKFIDNTRVDTDGDGDIDKDDDNFSTGETPIRTLEASQFNEGSFGLPVATVSFTSDELLAATGVDVSVIKGLDQFGIRMELRLTDGRIFTNTNTSGNVSGGTFFSSPFDYRSVISCSITGDLSGNHTYVTTDMIPAAGGGPCDMMISGTVTWEATEDPGVYTTSDFGFGQFDACWNEDTATSNNALVTWFCNMLEPSGEDQEENSYTYEITNVSGANMTIEWVNSRGDSGITILTRQSNLPWPDIFLQNND